MADLSFLEEASASSQVVAEIRLMGVKLKELKATLKAAEEAYKAADKAYYDYATSELPRLMAANGLTSLTMVDGSVLKTKVNSHCAINKNREDRARVASWLKEHGGSALVKEELVVPVANKTELLTAGVPFEESMEMNTNSVKAFLIDALGQNGSPAVINRMDIPKGINFFQTTEAIFQ